MENTREIVLDMLMEVDKESAFSNQLMKQVLDKYDYLESRDKAFMKRLFEGTLEKRIELDYKLNQVASMPVHKMKPLIRNILRMSAYQILYMDSVPDSAACNEAVKLAGKRKFHNLKGFVNGILRSVAKQKDTLTLPCKEENAAFYYSICYSCPQWIVELWLEQYGEAVTEEILKGISTIHPVTFRFVRNLPEAVRLQDVEDWKQNNGVQVFWAELDTEGAICFGEGLDTVTDLKGFWEGHFVIQDMSSYLAVLAADIKENDSVCDICAAPGGKTILASEFAKQVLSRDVSENKISKIRENVERMKRTNISLEVWDATCHDAEKEAYADVLIADVPCSGLGVMGKKRDIRYRISQNQLQEIVELQKKILESSLAYVKPGGTCLYSTCTIHRAENQDMVKWICEHFGFRVQEIPPRIMGMVRKGSYLEDTTYGLQLLPNEALDGFFFAILKKPE